MTRVDAIVIVFVAVAAFVGFRKGLIASALSLVGIVIGAIAGARLAPYLLAQGSSSPYTPLIGLAGAGIGAVVLETLGTVAGALLRRRLRFSGVQTLDTAGGLVLGAIAGFAVVWVIGAVALHYPGRPELRRGAQASSVLQHLNALVPPRQLMRELARVDPFPTITGPDAPVDPPDPAVLDQPGVRQAAPSVLRVTGTACGLGVSGSGWIAGADLVVTAAHVVAGQTDTTVEPAGGVPRLAAQAVFFDRTNDIAVLRVPGLDAAPLELASPEPGAEVAILGFPESGPFDAAPARVGRTQRVFARDAYGRGPVTRTITSVRGKVRHGNSGGPAVDARGRVQSTIFAARPGGNVGYGVPASLVRRALASAQSPVSTGDCAE